MISTNNTTEYGDDDEVATMIFSTATPAEEDCQQQYENLTYMNISCHSQIDYSVILYGYCMPVMLLITITVNSLIVVVLSQKKMKTTSNSVLLAMALCDMFTLLFPAPGMLYMYTFGNHYKPLAPVAACYMWNLFNEVIPVMFHTASIWLTLLLAVQRYICVCCGPVARQQCNQTVVNRWIIGICVAAFLNQSTRLFERSYTIVTIQWNGEPTSVCHTEISDFITHYLDVDIYFTSYYLFRIVCVHLMPCISLVTINVLLCKALRKAQQNREKLLRDHRKTECRTTLMLIVVVTVFLIVEVPIAVITALHIVSALWISLLDYQIANMFLMFTNFILVLSYPINFAIYCGMSRQFRETFRELFIGEAVTVNGKSVNLSCRYSLVNGTRTCTNETEL